MLFFDSLSHSRVNQISEHIAPIAVLDRRGNSLFQESMSVLLLPNFAYYFRGFPFKKEDKAPDTFFQQEHFLLFFPWVYAK